MKLRNLLEEENEYDWVKNQNDAFDVLGEVAEDPGSVEDLFIRLKDLKIDAAKFATFLTKKIANTEGWAVSDIRNINEVGKRVLGAKFKVKV